MKSRIYRADNLKGAARVLYNNRFFSLTMLGLLLAFAVVGFFFPHLFPSEQAKIVNDITSLTQGKPFLELTSIIILNNLRTALIGIFLGFVFGIVPVLAVMLNGYILGSVLRSAWKVAGAYTFLLILPHGIFELPALAIAFGMGIKLGLWFKESRKIEYIKSTLRESALVYVYIVLPMLVIAGIIESSLINFL